MEAAEEFRVVVATEMLVVECRPCLDQQVEQRMKMAVEVEAEETLAEKI